MTDYLMFGKHEPTRRQRIKRKLPSLWINYSRAESTWTVRRSWRDGSTGEARAHTLKAAWRLRARRGRAAALTIEMRDTPIVPTRPLDRSDETGGPRR